MNKPLLAFDNDGVLRDESVSYLRCIRETVAHFSQQGQATEKEMIDSMKESNDDWERTHTILMARGVDIDFQTVKDYFQDLYLGKKRDFTGYINDEPWLVDIKLLEKLSERYTLVIISGAPKSEILYTLKRNKADKYFSLVLGMDDCRDKMDGMLKVIKIFNPSRIYFCDDRPSPLKVMKILKVDYKMGIYGILPPKMDESWKNILSEAGAEQIFNNVNDYCSFILKNENPIS